MYPIRVLLVDDNVEFLESAAHFLAATTETVVIGCARSGREAIRRLDELHPDLILMDLVMPGMDGLEATRCIKARPAAPRVVILTLFNGAEYRTAVLDAHADGVLAKSEFGSRLLPLIHNLFDAPAGDSTQGNEPLHASI